VRADKEISSAIAELAGAGSGELGALGLVEVPDRAGGGIEER